MRTPLVPLRGVVAARPPSRICDRGAVWRAPEPACSVVGALPHEVSVQQLGMATLARRSTPGGAAAWQLAVAFVLGGLFVRTASGAVSRMNAFGRSNVARFYRSGTAAVRRTWAIMVTMLGAASMVLLRCNLPGAPCVDPDEECELPRSRWAEAWAILRAGFVEARRSASEGVKALKTELELYSAAVGAPGMATLQYVVDRLTPFRLADCLEEALTESLAEMEPVGTRRLVLRSFRVGETPPTLLAARAYDVGPDALAFDIDVSWQSQMAFEMDAVAESALAESASARDEQYEGGGPYARPAASAATRDNRLGARVPVSVRNVRFVGPVRVVVTHLIPEDPGYGAILLSLPSLPELSLEARAVTRGRGVWPLRVGSSGPSCPSRREPLRPRSRCVAAA